MKYKRTYADRAEYFKQAVSKRRRKIKEMLIEYKGGKCIICGYVRYYGALDLHHIDGSQKESGLGAKGLTRSWAKSKREADKCILVCANCHREIHGGITQLPRVSLVETSRDNGEVRLLPDNTVGTSHISSVEGAP